MVTPTLLFVIHSAGKSRGRSQAIIIKVKSLKREIMQLIDLDMLDRNCASDNSMKRDLVMMSMERLENSLEEFERSLATGNWDNLGRTIHKLRPVLSYCGITGLNDELETYEVNAMERKNLEELPEKISGVSSILSSALEELKDLLTTLT